MGYIRKGQLTTDGEWRKHLRKWGKRVFHKRERRAWTRQSRKEAAERRQGD
jgi:hypothetical protein